MKKFFASMTACAASSALCAASPEPVDYVNPYMGNISHVLKPTYPTVQLPNSMMRVVPKRDNFSEAQVEGLPVAMFAHRNLPRNGIEVFSSDAPEADAENAYPRKYFYDREKITPYSLSVFLEGENVSAKFAPSFKSAVWELDFSESKPAQRAVKLWAAPGRARAKDGRIGFTQDLPGGAKMHIEMEFETAPERVFETSDGSAAVAVFPKGAAAVRARYGMSFISPERALENLRREMPDFDADRAAAEGRRIWNEKLSKIKVKGNEGYMRTFYTSLWRTYERMVDFSEYGAHYNPFDKSVRESPSPFYSDDWIWDTYRTVHPLRILIEPEMEADMLNSYMEMAEASPEKWLPTFPQIFGDAHCMNGFHIVPSLLDACVKGLPGVDARRAFELSKNTLETATIIPWARAKAGELDAFYAESGYFPALREGERESAANVNRFERRQAVAVTLAAAYDDWCLAGLAALAGDSGTASKYSARALNYRNLFNPATQFFHPKDKAGKFIEPFDYRFSGGAGFRDYYDENNGHTYRWDVPHDFEGLVSLMGGAENFAGNLDSLFSTPLGKEKREFYAQNGPDQTGNIGQFAMGNEPSFHIPYLYNCAGLPWRTQKTVRMASEMWIRNDLMGVPGDEDGGAMSAFMVFTQLGFYPASVGKPHYEIGSPFFEEALIDLGGGKTFKITAKNASRENKYIQSARLNGRPFNSSRLSHADVAAGGVLEFEMGEKPNRAWGLARQ